MTKAKPGFFIRQAIKRIEAQAAETSEDIMLWANELAREAVLRYREYGYLRHHLSAPELKRFENWKNDFLRLYERTARGPSYVTPERLDWIMDRQSIEHTLENWASWPIQKRTEPESWHTLIFSALWSCPDRALSLLEVTTEDFIPPGYALQDAIHFLAKWQRQKLAGEKRTSHAEALCKFVITIINKTPQKHVRIRQNTIYNLIRTTSIEGIEALYHCLKEYRHNLHRHTLFCMAKRIARTPQTKTLALQMAVEAVEKGGADLNSGQWISLCTIILSLHPEHIKTSDEFSAADAFSVLLEHGFVPNMISYTALMRSLCLTGQTEKAWEVFQVMQRHDIKPDTIMWATLLDGAKRALSASTIEMIVAGAAESNAIDVDFINDLLFSLLHFSETETREKKKPVHGSVPAFRPMLHFYSKIFHLAPLQSLIPVNLSRYLDASRGLEMPPDWQLARQLFPALDAAMSAVPHKLNPTGATLGIMFNAYVKSLSQPISLISLYAYFRQLISKGNPVATNFVREKGTFVYDVVIKALCESPGMLRAALDIIGDMLKHTLNARSKSVSDSKEPAVEAAAAAPLSPSPPLYPAPSIFTAAPSSPSPPLHPAPSIFTWSILLHGFMLHKEKASGERILAMMRQHGVKPNLVTWNTLISGHAKTQDVGKTVHSLQRLEMAGYEADEYTLKAFSKLVNRETALRMMEESIDAKKRSEAMKVRLVLDADAELQL
ncbi:pentatricopeptide repeat domain-containing protein [Colletotrichum graminicola M1.001]|uniref:Pentatricopeptide repeat domain-containing protein n=1 Tax=Colletotrichum graminicola (strain M1.001 / M2 / FGSC 10212) TaxID=645133 RepID=E3QBH8_COLGM|nr:pentatricopeptide repeat domain-containing protein [Colletotrichum graminicola M1.001]EFQ28317.1 pentatricopeptide repeat domain-containing protein [Colletotrichum graminicola M1.001]